MGFLQAVTDFFQSIFMSSSPEVKKRTELHKIENELKALPFQIYKNGMLQPNFAELFRILYENTKPIDDILASTINSENVHRAKLFESQLIVTGFSPDTQEKIGKLSYESRKKAVVDSDLPINKVLDSQKHTMESILRQIKTPEFAKIDQTISRLKQLADICRFNYVSIIKVFDSNFDGITSSSFGNVHPALPEQAEPALMDFYYIIGNFELDTAEARAIIALKQLSSGNEVPEKKQQEILQNLRKINSVFTKYLTADVIRKVICLGKKDPKPVLDTTAYQSNSLKSFIEGFQGKFASDSERIKGEIKDYTVSFEIKELFNDEPILELKTYNAETNSLLRKNTPFSFVWITPLQVIKTFMATYMTEPVMNVLNNIVIEGFFNNSDYKTQFSSIVYAVNEINQNISDFEDSFDREKKNDAAELTGLIQDSKRDSDFLKKVGVMVDNINEQAHKLVQECSSNFFDLYREIGELIVDAKKSKSDIVSNIKVLLSSTRNRDGSGVIEQQHGNWKLFLKIMKNYAIIGDIEHDHE